MSLKSRGGVEKNQRTLQTSFKYNPDTGYVHFAFNMLVQVCVSFCIIFQRIDNRSVYIIIIIVIITGDSGRHIGNGKPWPNWVAQGVGSVYQWDSCRFSGIICV